MGKRAKLNCYLGIENFPEYDMSKYPFVVVRFDENTMKCWYYGAYETLERANMAAEEIGGFVVVNMEVIEK